MSVETAESRVSPLSPIVEVHSPVPPSPPYFRSQNLDKLMVDNDPNSAPRGLIPPRLTRDIEHCLVCLHPGSRLAMFHCVECLHDFHPPCISAYPVQSANDARFRLFMCPPCARDRSRRSRMARKRKPRWSSDSDEE